MKKIYFAVPIAGGHVDKEEVDAILGILRKHGEVYCPYEFFDKREERISDEYIFSRDIKNLRDSNYVVALVSVPSFGVGFEVGFSYVAYLQTSNLIPAKKIILLYKKQERKFSSMGLGNPETPVIIYEKISDLEKELDKLFDL